MYVVETPPSYKKIHWRKREKMYCQFCFLCSCWRHKNRRTRFSWARADYLSFHRQRACNGKTMGNKETGLETCWRDRRNLVEICDVTKMVFWSVGHYSSRDPSAKAIVRKFSLLLYKRRCLHMHWTWLVICLLLTGSKSDIERFSWRHLAMAGEYTFVEETTNYDDN